MLLQANALRIPVASEVVQCCVTSPPYWGLRDYKLGDAGIGLEKTPEEYVANIVQVFREVWRVLMPDGTLWLNLGDCYASGAKSGEGEKRTASAKLHASATDPSLNCQRRSPVPPGLKPKDLVGIPWRVAFALQADGWYLRSDIIWAKPNPMPESVTDRPTKSHEYLFLLAKQAHYYYDADAIREPVQQASIDRAKYEFTGMKKLRDHPSGRGNTGNREQANCPAGRNRRTVWTIPTQPYRGAHFATYPEKLVEPCILAGSSPKACGVCGAPWERVIDVDYTEAGKGNNNMARKGADFEGTGSARPYETRKLRNTTTRGWRPTCDHNDDTGKCLVLDPFCGSGTTGAVAKRLGRDFVGMDMSAEYLKLARERIGAVTVGMRLA